MATKSYGGSRLAKVKVRGTWAAEQIKAGKLKDEFEVPTQLFINGQWVESKSGKTFSTIDPTTETPIVEGLSEAGVEDVELAVKAARAAFEGPWSAENMAPSQRGRLLNKLADLIEEHRAEFALLESMDVGKPIFESYNFDFQQVINAYRYYAGYADKIHGKTIPIPGNNLCYTKHVPLGVVGLIMPWNFPSQLLAWKLAPALATGNTVVIKPAKESPLTTTFLARMIEEAGFPPGVVNVLNGSGSVIGMALCSHMDVDKIGFTGSTDVGRTIQIACAKSNLKPCSLELGGKSPIIVFDDVPDLDACVLDSYYALFWNAGQCCSAGSRIYVHEKVYDDFITKMVDLVKKRKIGDPLDDGVEQGPQVSKSQLNSVSEYIESGKKENARLVYGGSRPSGFSKGFYLEPTIFADVKDDMKICREEIFGPVMSILKFTDTADVIKRANDSIFGLVGSVYTKDVSKAIYVSDRVQSGLVWVNCYNVIDSAVPWGGFKQSGHGRDLSKYALQNYTQPKTVIIAPKL